MSYPFKRILITGGSGFLGQHLIEAAPSAAQILSLYHQHPLQDTPAEQWPADLTDESTIAALLRDWQPDLVIHAAALSDTHICESDPELSNQINVCATAHMAAHCHYLGIPLVFTSTDLVFDGKKPPYLPQDTVAPVSTYGRHKVAAEQVLRERHPEAIIARLPVMYGLAREERSNVLTALLRQWANGHIPNLFTDEYRSMAHAKDVAEGLYRVALHPGQVFHVGGPSPVSRFAFGEAVRKVLGLPTDCICGVRQQEISLAAPRPADVTLDSRSAYVIGFRPTDISTALEGLAPALQLTYQHWQNNG